VDSELMMQVSIFKAFEGANGKIEQYLEFALC